MADHVQGAFTRGELADGLKGRVDTSAYQVGLETALNLSIHTSGGASNRPGLEFVGEVFNEQETPRLVEFAFKDTDTYILELGDLYMRVIRDGGHVTTSAKTITDITQADPAVVTAASHGYLTGQHVVLSGVVGMTEVNGRRFRVGATTASTFELLDLATGADVDSTIFTAYASGGTAELVFLLTTPYAIGDVMNLKFAQSADVMTITHPDYALRELSRSDHDAWTLAEPVYAPEQIFPTGLAASQGGTPGSTVYKYQVTAIADGSFEESLPALNATGATITNITNADPAVVTAAGHPFSDGDEIGIVSVVGMIEVNNRRFKVAGATASTFQLKDEDSTGYSAYSSGGVAARTFVEVTDGAATLDATDAITISWVGAEGAQRYAVYKDDNGLYGLLGETESLSYVDDGDIDPPDTSTTPPRLREPFRGEGNQPATVGFYEQRRAAGGSDNFPDSVDYSRVADFSNYTSSTPVQADDAFRATLVSGKVNRVRHLVSLDDLLVFTTGGTWRLNSGTDARFSADTIRQKPQTRWACSQIAPMVIGRVVMFVTETGRQLRSIGFNWTVDGYTGTDMSLLAEHLFRDTPIVDAAYGLSTEPLVYCVRDDGLVGVMTFHEEQEIIAWTRWKTRTPDKIERVATTRPSASAAGQEGYFVVRRLINGVWRRFIERTAPRRFSDIRDCFFVDAGVTYDQPIAIQSVLTTNPVTINLLTGHGLQVGDPVDVDDITWVPDVDSRGNETQPAQLNTGRYVVENSTATSITLKDFDTGVGIDGSAFNNYVEGGAVRKVVAGVSGLHHLAGATDVTVLADGVPNHDQSVSVTGVLALDSGQVFSRAHLGFGYNADCELLNITNPGGATIEAQRKNVHEVMLQLYRTTGLWIGPSAEELIDTPWRKSENYGVATGLFTGRFFVTTPATWHSGEDDKIAGGRVFIRQRDPLPMTILMAVPRFELEEVES